MTLLTVEQKEEIKSIGKMIAKDMENKYFFRETSKELAYTALKTNIATLNNPYSNEYINSNFSLNMEEQKWNF